MYFINMSSTGLIDVNANYINSDIIDVNEKLTVNNINILELINNNFHDLSENIFDLSENIIDLINNNFNDLSENIFDLSGNIINNINNLLEIFFDLSGNIIDNIFDLSGNINNNINDISENIIDVSGNLNNLINTVTDLSQNLYDLSENVSGIKLTNTMQDIKLLGQGAQISANTDALVALGGVVATNVANTLANSAIITGIVLTIGIPSVAGVTPSTGLYGAIDSKTSRSLFGSGNIAIYGLGPLEYINLVYNNDHFEDKKLISNHALNLKEPYKSLPSVVDTINNNKQDNLFFTSPLLKDISNNITIDLSGYAIGNIKGTKATLNEGYLDPSGNSLIFYLHLHY